MGKILVICLIGGVIVLCMMLFSIQKFDTHSLEYYYYQSHPVPDGGIPVTDKTALLELSWVPIIGLLILVIAFGVFALTG